MGLQAKLAKNDHFLNGKINHNALNLLSSLCEIQELLYASEEKRTTRNILRLYNVTFLHANQLIQSIPIPKSLTTRKLYGQYFHSIIKHSPDQFRLISGSSANAEDEERWFNFVKNITKETSNNYPDNIIVNAFLRSQVHEINKSAAVRQSENLIVKTSKSLKARQNSFFTFKFIREKPVVVAIPSRTYC